VARDRDRDRVAAIGVPDRARRAGEPTPRDLAVARGRAERDLAQRAPDTALELAAVRIDGQRRERSAVAAK
jgi:hypothetical protein